MCVFKLSPQNASEAAWPATRGGGPLPTQGGGPLPTEGVGPLPTRGGGPLPGGHVPANGE